MKRKLNALTLILTLLTTLCALAETTHYGTMMVDNCKDWVSLRETPSKKGKRLIKVPLYAIVTDAQGSDEYGDFIYCDYNGQTGYILSQYLVPWADPEPEEGYVLDVDVNGCRVTATRTYEGDSEELRVACETPSGENIWNYETATDYITELTLTQAFIGGTKASPLVLVYNAASGLTALDPATGAEKWTVEDRWLGAGNTWVVGEEGTLYIGGYYGPDPVAIDKDGMVLWRADSDGCSWLYDMRIEGDELVCTYDMMDVGEGGHVRFSLSGELLGKTYD